MPEIKELLIRTNEPVAELNRVPGFDPVKLLQGTLSSGKPADGERIQLILKYKKLWFRLACPHGRIRVTALRLTEQMAIVQAEIFRDKDDEKPVSNFVASRTVHNTPGGLYIQAAEYEAVDNALTDAGFGIQLCDGCKTWGEEAYTPDPVQVADGAVSKGTNLPADLAEEKQETELPAHPQGQSTDQPEAETHEEALPAEQKTEPPEDLEDTVTVGDSMEPEAVVTDGPELQSDGGDQPPEDAGEHGQTGGEPSVTEPVSEGSAEAAAPTEQVMERITEAGKEDTDSEGTVSGTEDQQLPADAAGIAAVSEATETDAVPEAESEDGADGEMTLEEARNMIADVGSCRGKTLAQIADRRPTTLRWYFTTCPDSSEQLKRAARLVFESLNLQRSA